MALLKDRNGVIDIDLPLSGSLDDPQFRVGPLIWKAFVGLLTKIATAPFALLARLGGRDDEINQVDFAAGSAALDAAAQERMAALVKALNERPSLELEVPTGYCTGCRWKAHWRNARLEARLAAAAGALPTWMKPSASSCCASNTRRKLANRRCRQRRSRCWSCARRKVKRCPGRRASNSSRRALREKQPASEAELGDLARARAQAIRDSLLGSGQIDAARVFVLGIKPVAAVEGKVRVELALK